MKHALILCALLLAIASSAALAQLPLAPRAPGGDPRMKADLLLVVAHPDDETAIGSLLAQLVLDEGKRVAVIYTNRGEGGGNSAGFEQSTSMGLIRETEARRALSTFGIFNVWFLDGRDTPGQDVFRSLQQLHHGAALEQVVRIMRLCKPEVVVTWLPHFCAGENHGDHQASGVVATEAFDMAGDPTVFPAQVAVPRERGDINNATEGVDAWQPKKIYYFSDAGHQVKAEGPVFDIGAVSPTRKAPYYQIAAESLHLFHKTQGDVSEAALKAKESGDYRQFKNEVARFNLIFGKALLSCVPSGGLFDGIEPGAKIAYARAHGYTIDGVSDARRTAALELGGVFAFYREFWKAHNIERIGPLIQPEIEIAAGSYMHVPLLLRNESRDSVEITLEPELEAGWKHASGSARYLLGPNEVYPVQAFLVAPSEARDTVSSVRWNASVRGTVIGTVELRVKLSEWTLPQ